MASSPLNGDRPPIQGFRRSFTVPSNPRRQLSVHERAGLSDADANSEIIFTHPSVRIISFAPPKESVVSKSSEKHVDADYPIDTIETLPWRSRTEDLTASGPMMIEKVRGSSWFIKCSSQFVYPILRNSQCWCVDGESKFVWRKGRLQYYRLELPTSTEEEKVKVKELKVAFAKVLKFEITPCPFKRGFHVDLPDDAITPRRKGKWTKKEDLLPNTPDTSTPSLRRTKGSRSWSLQAQSAIPVPESRRQSDQGFAKKLYPIGTRRETIGGTSLRPGTPSSTASSEDMEGQALPEDYSDHGSSVDNSGSSIKELQPSDDVNDPLDEDSGEEKALSEVAKSDLIEEQHPDLQKGIVPLPEAAMLPSDSPPADATTVESASKLEDDEVSAIPSVEDVVEKTASSEDEFVHISPLEPEHTESAPSSDDIEHDHAAENAIQVDLEPVTAILKDQDLAAEEPKLQPSPLISSVSHSDHDLASSELILEPEPPTMLEPASQESLEIHSELETVTASETTTTREEADTDLAQPPMPQVVDLSQIAESDLQENKTALDLSGIENTQCSRTSTPPLQERVEDEQAENGQEEPVTLNDLPAMDEVVDDAASVASTSDSFHTLASDQSPTTGAAHPLDHLELRRFQHARGLSEMTVTASNYDESSEEQPLERFVTSGENLEIPETPRLIKSSASDDSWPDVTTPSNVQDGLRQRLKSRRSLSPLPSSSNVFTPQTNNHNGHMTKVLLQKACSLALVKPVEVVVLIVHILARIAGGASLNDLLTGELFKRPEQHKRSSSFPDRISPQNNDDEDDFGVPLRGRTRSSEGAAPSSAHDGDTDSLFDLD